MKIIHLDELIKECGHFYIDSDNWCNNGYNCSHKDCEDKILFGKNNEVLKYEELDIMIIRYYRQNFNLKRKRLAKKKIKEYLKKRHDYEYWTKKFNILEVGRCFSFSCPLACRADLQDMQELDKELAEQFEDDISAIEADYMII